METIVEREKGFEPSTFAMATRRSSQLSYSRLMNSTKYVVNTKVKSMLSRNKSKDLFKKAGAFFSFTFVKLISLLRVVTLRTQVDYMANEHIYPLAFGEPLVSQYFERLRESMYQNFSFNASFASADNPTKKDVFLEYGKVLGGRSYFFVKPKDSLGWLFERSPTGWIVSRSEKIVKNNLFLRKGEPKDHVILYTPKERSASLRIESRITGTPMVSYRIYEKKIIDLILESAQDSDNL